MSVALKSPSDLESSVVMICTGAGVLKLLWRMRDPVTTSSPTVDGAEAASGFGGGGGAVGLSGVWAAAAVTANRALVKPLIMLVDRR